MPVFRRVDQYGNIRVYEFGPEDGRKILFIHGISTTCMTLQDVARPLAEKGCRVMLFVSSLPMPPPHQSEIRAARWQCSVSILKRGAQDLFGRGYSDAPGDVQYDERLYVTQALLALASSPLAWTGERAMSVVGYSLGGGIAAEFAAAYPHMVDTLVLLAPAGLIRPENFGRASRLVFASGIVPERLLAGLTRWRLRRPIDRAVAKRRRPSSAVEGRESVFDVADQEAADPNEAEPSPTPFERKVESVVHWTLDQHEGFVRAFMSTIRHGPLMGRQATWRRLARRRPGSTAVLLGRHDQLIQRDDYAEDALPLLGGPDRVFWRIVPGAHNFPFTNGPDALEHLYEFWGMGGGNQDRDEKE